MDIVGCAFSVLPYNLPSNKVFITLIIQIHMLREEGRFTAV